MIRAGIRSASWEVRFTPEGLISNVGEDRSPSSIDSVMIGARLGSALNAGMKASRVNERTVAAQDVIGDDQEKSAACVALLECFCVGWDPAALIPLTFDDPGFLGFGFLCFSGAAEGPFGIDLVSVFEDVRGLLDEIGTCCCDMSSD